MPKQPMPKKLGRYTIVRELGKGAMGIVYEGLDPNINRRVAIKTARKDVMESSGRVEEMMERFLREATAAGSLSHPNIITIYDAAEEGDLAYIAMEYLEGGDLFDVMEQKHRFTPEEAVDVAATICDALAEAHEHGIIHRDVKPANILMPTNAPLKVADFGIARIENSNLTQEGAMIGTPHYMSPEQFMGQRADARSDLFSVGIILYEMVTGEKPFAGEALSTVMHNVIKTHPVNPTELSYAIPPCLGKVILKALSKRSQDRYQTARAMAAALRESLKPNPDPAVTQVVCETEDATVITQDPRAAATVMSKNLPDGTAPAGRSRAVEAPDAPAKKKIPVLALIGGGLAVVALILTVVSLVSRGHKDTPEPTQTPPTAPVASPEPTQTEPYFSNAVICIYLADSEEILERAQKCVARAMKENEKPTFEDVPELKVFSGTATVTLTPKGDAKPPMTVEVKEAGTTVSFEGTDWTLFTAKATSPGYLPDEITHLAAKAGETRTVVLILLKADALR